VLRVAYAYEQATDWHKRRPSVPTTSNVQRATGNQQPATSDEGRE